MKITKLRASILGLLLITIAPMVMAGPEQHPSVAAITMTMADGVNLSADLYRPKGHGPFAVILARTPYGKSNMDFLGRGLAAAGFAVVIQDVRGKFASAGNAPPLLAERRDSLTSLDWLAKQTWCNGHIGMWGTSYLAYCALVPALDRHPNLKAIFINSAYLHADRLATVGGTNHLLLNLPWLWYSAARTNKNVADVPFEDLFLFTPQNDVFRAHGLQSHLWDHPEQFLTFNSDLSPSSLQIPTFHMTGWLDFVKDASLEIFQKAAAHSKAPQRLWVGPWFHDQVFSDYSEGGDVDFGSQSILGTQGVLALSINWFREHLLGQKQKLTGQPGQVRFFMMGDHQWHHAEQWPPKGVSTQTWFLSSRRGANSLHGDGSLSLHSYPTPGKDRFEFDPLKPIPTLGGANFHFFLPLLGVRDQREIEKRQDVLVYSSTPLPAKQWLVGPILARLFVSSDGRDTDITAKLVLVHPDGYARIVEESIARLSHVLGAQTKLQTNQIVEVNLKLGHTAIAIPQGHRLRLEVSSSNFPKYDRNPNTGENPFTATTFQKVTNTIHFGPDHPSAIVLSFWTPPKNRTPPGRH